ncbi:MAG: tetratricopeptide repeat protein [Acidobacteriota bacterium]|nr:tetratricopeptide repeat protein [Acidobacteriota bacterium]
MNKASITKLTVFIFAAISLTACSSKTRAVEEPPLSPQAVAVPPSENIRANPTILFLEERIKRDPADFIALNKLANEYARQFRESGDAAFLNLALRAARKSLKIMPAEFNLDGLLALAQAEYSSHDFTAARVHAEQLASLEPAKGYTYHLLGDALLELGEYKRADEAFKKMAEFGGIQPVTLIAMEQRLAHWAMLNGDTPKATIHLNKALKLAKSPPGVPLETIAFCNWQLGEAAFMRGDYVAAEKYYTAALKLIPDYYRAVASQGRILASRGDLPGAIKTYEGVVKRLPDLNYVAALGDLYMQSGRHADAHSQYALVEQIGRLQQTTGPLYNRQLALYYADHDLKPDEAYSMAVSEYQIRKDIYGADTVAWTAYKAGRLAEARMAIKEALQLGTRDARLFYHAGLIARASGDKVEAEKMIGLALRLNPKFDLLQAENARMVFSELRKQ